VACWWPGGASDLRSKLKETNPRCFSDFYTRVLSERSRVEILAVNELPLGCRGSTAPKVVWEIWCADPDRRDSDGGRGLPVAVCYVRFREDYSQPPPARHSSVSCMHITFCRIDDSFADSITHTHGVENCENLWVKVLEMEDTISKLHTVEVRDLGWKWRQPWESTMHCSRINAGHEQACWTAHDALTPLLRPGQPGAKKNDQVCDECLAFAAVYKLLEVAANDIVLHANMQVDGLCLPITVEEHTALASYENVAMLFSFESSAMAVQKNGVAHFGEHLESLHWRTQLFENASKLATERTISGSISSVKFRNGSNLYLFVGHVVRIQESTYILSDDVTIVTSYKYNRVDWEAEIKDKAFSLDWLQQQLAAVRPYAAPPCFLIVDSQERSGDVSVHAVPKCKHRAYNSLVVRSFRDTQPLTWAHEAESQQEHMLGRAGSQFLSRLQYMLIQRALETRDVLMRLNTEFQGQKAECHIAVDYDGMCNNFYFHPKIGQPRSYEVELEDRLALVQSFALPLMCGPPHEAYAGNPHLMDRKVRLPSLGAGAQDCLDYLESRYEAHNFRGTCLLHGDRGTGKATMAAALMQRLYWKRSGSAFFWLHASNTCQLYHDILKLAKYLGLVDDHEVDVEAVLARLRHWMSSHAGWFLVLQDAEDEAVVQFLDVPVDSGMVLVTSGPTHWESVAWHNLVELPNLSHDEGHAFVVRLMRNEQPAMVDSLLRELNHHPLSVNLALCLMRQEKMKLVKFMATKKPLDLAAEMRYCSVGMSSLEHSNLAALMSVVALLLQALQNLDSMLPVVLVACACSHGNGIHRNMFEHDLHCDKRLDTLLRYGCLAVSGDSTLQMNPLLQLAVREHLPHLHLHGLDNLCTLLQTGMLHQGIDKQGSVALRAERGAWLVHVLEAEALGGTFSFSFLRACADYMVCKMHEFDEPLRLLQKLATQVQSYDTDYPRLLSVALKTGEIHVLRQEFHEGLFHLEQFITMFNALDCQPDGVFAKATCLVGDCLRANGKHADALNRYQQALFNCSEFEPPEPDTKKLGANKRVGGWFVFFMRLKMEMNHVTDMESTARSFVMDLARAVDIPSDRLKLEKMGLNTSQAPFQEMLSGRIMVEMKVKSDIEWDLPPEKCKSPLEMVQSIHQMAGQADEMLVDGVKTPNVLKQGKLTALIEGASCVAIGRGYERVKELQAHILCKVGDAMSDLGDDCEAECNYAKALHMLTQVLQVVGKHSMHKDSMDKDWMHSSIKHSIHTSIATSLFKLAEARLKQGKMHKAMDALHECLPMRTRLLGHLHRAVGEVYELHGNVREQQGRFPEAVLALDRAKRIYRLCLGPASWEVARVSVAIGMAQDQLGHSDSAKAEYTTSLRIYETYKDSVNGGRCLNNLGIIARKQSNTTEALELLHKAKECISSNLGQGNLEFAGILGNIGIVHVQREEWSQAQTHLEKALTIVGECGGKETPEPPKLSIRLQVSKL